MAMESSESKVHGREDGVQSVRRALRLLEALNRRSISSIAHLHEETQLPKPTIVRMLRTLAAEGYVASGPRQAGYSVTAQVNSLSCGYHGDPMVVEAAKPWAIALTRRFGWPVGVGMLDHNVVVIRFSTIPDSAISPFHSSVNRRLGLVSRALGLAYFAFCPEEERRLLLRQLDEEDGTLLAQREAGWLDRRVDIARKHGFSRRDPGVQPSNSDTVAVPIRAQGRIAATIGLTYFRVGASEEDVASFAEALKASAIEIGDQIERLA
jgi:IclR family transcriptional regulator, mhp operon transcriptional activator